MDHFCIISVSFLDHFWVIFETVLGEFQVSFGSFLVSFESFLGHSGSMEMKLKRNENGMRMK